MSGVGRYKRQRWWTHKDAQEHGWHSRRHETREAQDAARECYQEKRGVRVSRRKKAQP